MLALTKMDLPGSEERREEVEKGWKEVLEKGPSASGLPDHLLPTSLCQINQTVAISLYNKDSNRNITNIDMS